MQIFVQFLSSVKCVNVDSNATVDTLREIICRLFSISSTFAMIGLNSSDSLIEGQTIRVHGQLLGGGKNMSEGDKLLSLQSIECLICRKCYARNPVKAKICRKSGCGNCSDLRLKKVLTKKK